MCNICFFVCLLLFFNLSACIYNIYFCLYLRPRWVVPVLPKGELEVLLEAGIDLSKKGKSTQSLL